MKLMTIKKTDLARALEKIRKSYRLTGPVKDKDGYVFRPLQNNELPDLDYDMTRLSPKAVVFPQTEPLFALSYEQGDKTKPVLEETVSHDLPGAVMGIRPYDAKALHLLKLNFDTPEFKDPYFIRKFEALTLVGLAENHPGPANFSTSCGTGPFDETYLDILLMDTGDEYTGKILTPKGEAFAACAGWTPAEAPAPGLEEKLAEMKSQAEAEIESRIDFAHIREAGIQALYDAPFWKDLAFACINCSTCTFACPTCWCFDIQDETGKDNGVRLRLWDSCMPDLYSAHASGHNPRSEGWQRFRNRFMHKLKYFTDKYQEGIMCVGCGRCISLCPAHIDIRKICDTLNQKEAS
jgi:ferredoxin